MQAFSSSVNKGALKLAPKKQSLRLPRARSRRNTHQDDATPRHVSSADDVPHAEAQDIEASSGTVADGATKLTTRTVPVVMSSDAAVMSSVAACADLSQSATEHELQERRKVAHDGTKQLSSTTKSGLNVPELSSSVSRESGVTPAEKDIDDTAASALPSSRNTQSVMLRSSRHADCSLIPRKNSTSRTPLCINKNPSQAHNKSLRKDQEYHYSDNSREDSLEGLGKDESLIPIRGASRRQKRESSQQGSQSEIIDVGLFKMATLCKDIGIGKESSKFAAFTAISTRRRKRRKVQVDVVDETQEQRHSSSVALESACQGETPDMPPDDLQSRITTGAPQVRIVNGEIVLDVKSLQVDRAMRDAPADEHIEYVEDNPLEKIVNSRSYSKHKPSPRWDSISCDKFYKGLSQFGTDFQMISQMFPDRNRRQIKNKFSLEERRNPALIESALAKKEPIDMEQHSVICDMEFRSIAVLEEELVQLKAQFESERQEALKDVEKRKSEMLAESIVGRTEHTIKSKKRRRRADDGLELVGTIEQVEAQEAEAARIAAESSDET